jgi:hypothetical protein
MHANIADSRILLAEINFTNATGTHCTTRPNPMKIA